MANKPKIIEMSELEDATIAQPASVPEPFAEQEDEEETTGASPTEKKLSPAEAAAHLKQLSASLIDLYARYAKLHGLAKELNGVAESAPFPNNVIISQIVISYQISDGDTVNAEILNTQHVGEIGSLLRVEIERVVDQILLTLAQIREISTAAEQSCNQAKFYSRMSQSKNVPT